MLIEDRTTPRLEALRADVRNWLAQELPVEYEGFEWDYDEGPEPWAFYRSFWRKLGAKGWLEPGWPAQYGGLEYAPPAVEAVKQELARRRAGGLAGIGMVVGPAILRLGTAEQKKALLPGMAAGEIMWAEGYTEPDSGSDLASLRTRAVADGTDWVINGTKTFCTAGHHCNWIIIAARTDPDLTRRHRGISYFLVPTDTKGIELRPIHNLAGGRQNLVLLDDVRAPAESLFGDLNKGWTQIWFGLGGEQIPKFADDDPGPFTAYDPPPEGQAWLLREVVRHCQRTTRQGRPMSEDPMVRRQLAELAVGVEIDRVLALEANCTYGPHLHQAVTKEFEPEFAQTAMDIVGPLAQIQDGPLAPLAGEVDRAYRQSFGNHAGGTSQLKRMVMATRNLGLPR